MEVQGIRTVVEIATAVVAVASLVANLTPTDADNKVIRVVSSVINLFALNWAKKGK